MGKLGIIALLAGSAILAIPGTASALKRSTVVGAGAGAVAGAVVAGPVGAVGGAVGGYAGSKAHGRRRAAPRRRR